METATLKPTHAMASPCAASTVAEESTTCPRTKSDAMVSYNNKTVSTSSSSKIVILKVSTSTISGTPSGDGSCKRPASDLEADCSSSSSQEHQPKKKACLVLVAPIGPAGEPRTVHFELVAEGNGRIKTHVRIFDRVEASEAGDIWWSQDEMGEIHAREKSAVSVMSFCCEHYTSQVLSVLREARNSLNQQQQRSSSSITAGATAAASPESIWVANSPARGLERDIVQAFKLRKRQVIRKVLESQRTLQQGRHRVTGEAPSLEMQRNVLSTQYQRWSYPMMRFAQVLAEGDAQVVVDNNNSNNGGGSNNNNNQSPTSGLPPLEAF